MSHTEFVFAKTRYLLGVACFAVSLLLIAGTANAAYESAAAPAGQSAQPQQVTYTDNVMLDGSAQNVPLSVALRQILPKEKGFMIIENVDPSMPVSWKGGAPWRDVLNAMLKSVGLIGLDKGPYYEIRRIVISTLPGEINGAGTETGTGATGKETGEDSTGEVRVWSANRGDTLRSVLKDWTKIAGIGLQWDSGFDFPLLAEVRVEGTFEEAARILISGFEKAEPQPYGKLYKNTSVGSSVLVMETRGNNYGG